MLHCSFLRVIPIKNASKRLIIVRSLTSAPAKTSEAEKQQDSLKNIDAGEKYTALGNIRQKKDVFHYTDRASGVGYSHYSSSVYQHRPYIWPPLRKLYHWNYALVIAGMVILMSDFEWLKDQIKSASLPFRPEASQKEEVTESNGEVEEVKEKPKKKKLGFRERRIIEYEDRLRLYSTPDKIFRYFATLKIIDPNEDSGRFEVFMTPEDFLRSFTPGVMQPRRWGLDSFKNYNPEKHKRHKFSDPDSIFYKLGENGLINFSDYLFLMTLLSTSHADFALAFKIFDVDGNGALDKEEFTKVQQLIMSQTTVGQRHRDHITPNQSFRVETNSALETYFFGKDGKGSLSSEKFIEFQERLQHDILKMEFERRDALDNPDGLINEDSFAQLLLLHAQINEKKQKHMLKRVKRRFKGENLKGISFGETKAFFEFLYHIDDVDIALHFHKMAGMSIDAKLLQRVAVKVTGIPLSDHVVDVVITLFDDNLDGKLSHEEMVAVMRRRMRRGLERPRDTGLFRLFDAVLECGKRAYHASPLPFY
ncbi:Calcium uptake protein 1 homolog, mitochondrial [Caenorhabditis elegans]|uniref:Calcium uptake protein 1 homolog, mitochondrial n=1 Tax=Caenorhabditis elegans TaxID=6239 RepID=MICU1_CAEEL|nr:Calcium uptake protein 1 homolog, mitochondrial [Caenorhabditis elegans]Q95PZ2.2 RecName: Full=Calcium uptake protein 1 homolog, mitochondrial; Flags: Precursor [Caenorhabditis elegans]CCF23405.1 Calcium uptake protein 1 homolog, mitochondrial [Caenorhabditis elegans]|eukprot:NP_001255723.1 Calcium uptake protein 1 homolog, mitochondrial [Caenorhabditis elegans]